MIDRNEIETFLEEYIAIGVPHSIVPDKLFFYFGYLRYIDKEEIKIETNNGFKIIPISQIYDIHKARGKP